MKLFFRQNGFIVGFMKYNLDFLLYLLLRSLQFLFDIILPNIFMITLWRIYNLNIFMSTLFSFLFYIGFQLVGIIIFKNKSLGMAIGKLETVEKNGLFASRSIYFYRSIFSVLYLFPFLGWLLIIPSIISFVINKGISFIDLITKSQILPEYKAIHFNKILRNIKEG